jgi:Trp operon repressor
MVRVSKKPLSSSVRTRLNSQITKVFLQQRTQKSMSLLLLHVFGDEEHIMLMKRIAIIGMLYNKCSSYEIQKTLRVSTATVKKIRTGLLDGEYAQVELFFRQKKNRDDFWKTLEIMLRAGMPPIGRDRWSRTYKTIGTV